ncbi:MAG: lysine--tRNA ligase [Candidatus Komeilibacteria bacterium]
MFWGDKICDEIQGSLAAKIQSGQPLIIRDEKTMSGRVHVGSLRGVMIHGIINQILQERNIASKYLFEINDFDPFDGLPIYLDEKIYRPYMGRILKEVPSPDPAFPNLAEYVAAEFIQVVKATGFEPELYRSSALYLQGKFNDTIRLALDNAEKIRAIYQRVSGSDKGGEWLPVQLVCEQCKKVGTTKAVAWDGEKVTYRCEPDLVKWAQGCGYEGKVSPFDGHGKLPWKVEWAAKWKVIGVDIEGAGKDHSTKGGSREVSAAIAKEIFNYHNPLDIPYNFLVVGGKKMSSSKGLGSTAKDISDLLPPELTRLLMLRTRPAQEIDFEPEGDTVPVLYDYYDTLAASYWQKSHEDQARIFQLTHSLQQADKLQQRFLPRFGLIAYLSQMPHIDLATEVAKMKGSSLTAADAAEVEYRAKYAKNWLAKYSPEKFRLTIYTDRVPEAAQSLNANQKKALIEILNYIQTNDNLDGQALHSKLHEIKETQGIDPKELFEAIYQSFLNSSSGPKAGWFLSVLPRELLITRLQEVTK